MKEVDELIELCEPLIRYLKEHHDPYTTIHVNMDKVELSCVKLGIPVKQCGD